MNTEELKKEIMELSGAEIGSAREQLIEDNIISDLREMGYSIPYENEIISENTNNFEISEEEYVKIIEPYFKDFFEDFLRENITEICENVMSSDSSVCVDAYVNIETMNIFYVCECSNNYCLSPDSKAVYITGIRQGCDRDLEYHQCYDCCLHEQYENGEISEEEYFEQRRECEIEMHEEFFMENEMKDAIESGWDAFIGYY